MVLTKVYCDACEKEIAKGRALDSSVHIDIYGHELSKAHIILCNECYEALLTFDCRTYFLKPLIKQVFPKKEHG